VEQLKVLTFADGICEAIDHLLELSILRPQVLELGHKHTSLDIVQLLVARIALCLATAIKCSRMRLARLSRTPRWLRLVAIVPAVPLCEVLLLGEVGFEGSDKAVAGLLLLHSFQLGNHGQLSLEKMLYNLAAFDVLLTDFSEHGVFECQLAFSSEYLLCSVFVLLRLD